MKTTALTTPDPPYRAYLVRCWCDGKALSPTSWRFVVVEIDQDQRHGFVTLEALVSFLQAQLYGGEVANKEVTRTDHEQKDN